MNHFPRRICRKALVQSPIRQWFLLGQLHRTFADIPIAKGSLKASKRRSVGRGNFIALGFGLGSLVVAVGGMIIGTLVFLNNATNSRIDATTSRIDGTNTKIDAYKDSLDAKIDGQDRKIDGPRT